jgi:hypothetical protein
MQPHNFSLIKMSQLTNLVEIDKSEHKLKDIAILFLDAARDWDTNQTELSDFIGELKEYFGSPLTIDKIANKKFDNNKAWRHEAGSSIIEMLDLSERFYNQPNFDKILKDIIVYYKQQLDEL